MSSEFREALIVCTECGWSLVGTLPPQSSYYQEVRGSERLALQHHHRDTKEYGWSGHSSYLVLFGDNYFGAIYTNRAIVELTEDPNSTYFKNAMEKI